MRVMNSDLSLPEDVREALRQFGRLTQALRRRERKTCPVCERTFEAIRKARYCSAACKAKAYYWRNRQGVLERRRRRREDDSSETPPPEN